MGAWAVNFAKTWLTGAAPEIWLFFLGGLFILVTLLLPTGIMGALKGLRRRDPAPSIDDAPSKPREEKHA